MGCNFSQFLEDETGPTTTPVAAEDHKAGHQQQQQQHHSIVASHTEISTVYKELPDGSEKHPVQFVYDGDTLTLASQGQRRVRFLGIDTPELKEKQPFAEEAKQFTQSLCAKGKDIWLSFEHGNKEDHYGRLLAFVWVPAQQGKGWICVNEAIVAAGLASVYVPNASSKFFNKDKMLALQKQARLQRRGMWSEFKDTQVVKTENGTAYHIRSCSHLARTHNVTELRASEAADLGLHPCRTCLA